MGSVNAFAQRGDQVPALLINGTAPVEVVVVFGHFEQALARNVAAAEYIFQEGNDVFGVLRSAEGNNENRVVPHT